MIMRLCFKNIVNNTVIFFITNCIIFGDGFSSRSRSPLVTGKWSSFVPERQQPMKEEYCRNQQHTRQQPQKRIKINLKASSASSSSSSSSSDIALADGLQNNCKDNKFDLDVAMFCAGLAFDAYVKPPEDSSRWERGTKGMDVAFVSNAFTRNLYKGIVEITPIKAIGLPDEQDAVEGVLSGSGTDASLLVAAIEGQWKEDIKLIETQQYHDGIFDLTGAAHVSKSSTAWSNVDEKSAMNYKKKYGKGKPYHIKSSWGKGGQAVWPDDEPPFYIYVQDPASVRLVFTIMDDDVVGAGDPIGSTYKKLSDLIPAAKLSQEQLIDKIKAEIMEKIKRGELSESDLSNNDNSGNGNSAISSMMQQAGVGTFEGTLKLTSKPRIKDKNGQVMMAAAAGAVVAGPVGAAVGGMLANMYEGEVRGRFDVRLRYLPFPQGTPMKRNKYTVLGGMPGINWGALYERYLEDQLAITANSNSKLDNNQDGATLLNENESSDVDEEEQTNNDTETETPIATADNKNNKNRRMADLEHCFFIEHANTGGCCAVYRSLEEKLIVVSFRGTCELVDLITDASAIQEPWVEGEDAKKNPNIAEVHTGFRKSLNSISRRLKELILATTEPGENISEYDVLVTGHSLGGALATLFVADIGEFGIDAGRALPQAEPSEPWWKSISNFIAGAGEENISDNIAGPPRPKSLRMYNFGSPRVGNTKFAERFDSLVEEGKIDQAYRIVNGEDIVARLPRTVNAIVGSVNYEHVGSTVLVDSRIDTIPEETAISKPITLWIEGESDDSRCPVRDATNPLNNPISEGLLADLFDVTKNIDRGADARKQQIIEEKIANEKQGGFFSTFSSVASKVSDRLKTVTVSDLASVIGLDRSFTDRELKIIQSFVQGNALSHHMEDQYYTAMGRAAGFFVKAGEEKIEKIVVDGRS